MIEPAEKDIGRHVIYQAQHAGAPIEPGVITGFNPRVVFVRFSVTGGGIACARSDLRWEFPENWSEQ